MIKLSSSKIPESIFSYFQRGELALNAYLRNPETTVLPKFDLKGGATPLYAAFNEKCIFCESKQSGVEPLYYDHFRPLGNAADREGNISKQHYIWLTFRWDNLNLICGTCSKNKSNKFHTLRERAPFKVGLTSDQLISERSELNEIEFQLFFDPLHQNPEDWFYYNETGTIHILPRKDEFQAERGSYTIRTLDLNRSDLVNRRKKAIDDILNDLTNTQLNLGTNLPYEISDLLHTGNHEFTGAKRFFIKREIYVSNIFRSWVLRNQILNEVEVSEIVDFFRERPFLASSIPLENKTEETDETLPLRIKKIEIKNFRGIENLVINLEAKQSEGSFRENWLAIIGENGTGKSTILKAIHGCLNYSNSRINHSDFKSGGYIRVYTNHSEFYCQKNGELLVRSEKMNTTPIIGYGAIRISSSEFIREGINFSTISGTNLENHLKPVIDAEEWIKDRMTNEDISKTTIKEKLLELISLDNRYDLTVHENKVVIINKSTVSDFRYFGDLSTGYKQLITIACDLISKLERSFKDLSSATGIVLIDEIENHLHPKWKTEVVSKLRNMFPLVQFIITTHDPLCLNGLEDNEVLILRINEKGIVSSIADLPSPSMLTAEQLLTSPFFGLNSTYSAEIQNIFSELQLLKLKKELTEEELLFIDKYSNLFNERLLPGKNFKDWMINKVVEDLLELQKSKNDFNLKNIRKDIKDVAKKLLKEYFD